MMKLPAMALILGLAAAPAFAGGKVLTDEQLGKVTAGTNSSLTATCSSSCSFSATASDGVLVAYSITGGTLFFNGRQVAP